VPLPRRPRSSSTVATGDYQFTDGQTLLLIGRYVNAADPDADSLALIGFDVSNPTPLPPTFDLTNPAATLAFELSGVTIDLAQITSLALTIRGDANNFIDEIRIGDSYASVVPEPASGILLGIGLAGLVTFGRRRPRTSAGPPATVADPFHPTAVEELAAAGRRAES
jgi:hypothetical protein